MCRVLQEVGVSSPAARRRGCYVRESEVARVLEGQRRAGEESREVSTAGHQRSGHAEESGLYSHGSGGGGP